jgi:hypothetical protein
MVIQVPWIQVSRSRSLLLMVKPTVFLIAIGMGAYVFHSYFVVLLECHLSITFFMILFVKFVFLLDSSL